MHNCKATRKRLTEQAMETPSDQVQIGLTEVEGCSACLEDLTSIASLLRVTNHALDSVRPDESFWAGYHARLGQSLERDALSGSPSQSRRGTRRWLRPLLTSHIRVPVPVAAALVILFGLAIVFAVQSSRSPVVSISGPASVITRTIEVPIVHEKIVYVSGHGHAKQRNQLARSSPATVAIHKPDSNPLPSLAGFKPANEARLTIIKGSDRNDK